MQNKKKQIWIIVAIASVLIVVAGVGFQSKIAGKGFLGGFFRDTQDDVLYTAYKGYMAWTKQGVSSGWSVLPTALRQQLQPFYANDLRQVKFAYTNKLNNLGMTDCLRIYFGDRTIVDAMRRNERLSRSQFSWLAHELAHTEQCFRKGTRKKYALMWFSQVQSMLLDSVASGNFNTIVRNITRAERLARFDNNMTMEAQASSKSATVTQRAYR